MPAMARAMTGLSVGVWIAGAQSGEGDALANLWHVGVEGKRAVSRDAMRRGAQPILKVNGEPGLTAAVGADEDEG